ncbi:hypothetical protein [Aeoliella sp.]|uniref:hypothetical protein n=1 Tax=Aeoliella sp. TaxID=2795800 RepID=UPI003CCBCA6B
MSWLYRQRRRIATLLLIVFTAAATGVPLPVPRLASRLQERYPCENCGCGCNSATVCWTNCCCHTMAERLAWARREGVRPPQQALQLANAQGLDVRPWLESAPPQTTTCCTTPAPAKSKSCCCCKRPPAERATDENSTLPRTPVWQTASCQGVLKLWLSITVTPHTIEPCESPGLLCESLATPCEQLSIRLASAPPTPPPQPTA